MEEKLFRYISKVGADKIRLTEVIAHFTHEISGSEKETLIFKKILPELLNMEKGNRIKLSWDVMLSKYRFPRYIYCRPENIPFTNTNRKTAPLWQKQIEDILKREAANHQKKAHEQRLEDKFEKFLKKYEKSSGELIPSEEWIKVLTAFMETNLAQYDVMRACIEAFKAGVVWEKYKNEFGE
jgi:hypothetical protein